LARNVGAVGVSNPFFGVGQGQQGESSDADASGKDHQDHEGDSKCRTLSLNGRCAPNSLMIKWLEVAMDSNFLLNGEAATKSFPTTS